MSYDTWYVLSRNFHRFPLVISDSVWNITNSRGQYNKKNLEISTYTKQTSNWKHRHLQKTIAKSTSESAQLILGFLKTWIFKTRQVRVESESKIKYIKIIRYIISIVLSDCRMCYTTILIFYYYFLKNWSIIVNCLIFD